VLRKLLSIAFLLSALTGFTQAPSATIVVPTGTICTTQPIILNSLTSNTPTAFSWSINPPNGVNYIYSSAQTSVGITFSLAGVYSVSLTVSNVSGTVTTSTNVTVNRKPTASFSASLTSAGFPNELDATNFSTNATNYQWTFSDGPMVTTATDVVHTYSASGAYSVELVAYNVNGCSDTSRYSFYLADSSGITLPNFFTPNADGVNDVFKPIARGLSSLKMSIYNRFGILVYDTDKVNASWDGYTTSGMLCEPGTYFCVLEATGFDKKSYKLKSYISLFRN
jgi:gliding motility-associated-like protein